ncbi:MAG: LysE family translocator [Candidatus Babeliales bacterium]
MINFLKGILAGACISFPVGPIGIICLRRMLSQGALMGLASGLGSSSADILYSSLALTSLGFFYTFLVEHTVAIRIGAALFFALLGLKIIFSKPPRPLPSWSRDLPQAYISTLLLTLANPTLIISFIAIFAMLGITIQGGLFSFFAPVLGVFIGSSSWWFVLAFITEFYKITLLPETLRKLNTLFGFALILSALITAFTILIA